MRTVHSLVEVNVDVSTAYNQWTQFESLPQFMDHVVSVTPQGPKRSHWVMKLAGATREFDTEITEQVPDQVIAWRSTNDSGAHTGRVTFEPWGPSETRLDIRLGWEPVGLLEKTEAALNFDQHQVEKTAANFKEFIEGRGRQTSASRGDSTSR
jgi:uncharacterized membrane protein